MDIHAQRKIAAILRVLSEAGAPLGSTKIARSLRQRGIDIRGRMVRYYLEEMDRLGFTENLGRPGRRLTELGREEMESAVAVDRVGYVSARVDELAYKLTFDTETRKGTVILNYSSLPKSAEPTARQIMKKVLDAGLGMGKHIAPAEAGENLAGRQVGEGRTAYGTICSVTINGVLKNAGVPVTSRFGGLLELREGEPYRFTQIVNYDGTTIDPIEIFIKGQMTSVYEAAKTGTGTIGASFREVPAAALPRVQQVIAKLDQLGLNGVLMVGLPGQNILDVPVSQGRVGVVIAAGLNAIAAVEETGIPTENHAMSELCEFDRLVMLSW
ncbi:MAG: DUF128 domain-containing protein [Planctomycetes bacterium]|nr:DUF128 domain-containing protein [Planctomycetota bacterium]